MKSFKTYCDLLSIQGAIDGTHYFIFKPSEPFYKDHFYYKYGR